MSRYFARDADGNSETFDTEQQAREWAEGALECEADRAGDGWREEVTCICWGEIRQEVVQTSSRPDESGRFDTIDEYELMDVPRGERQLSGLGRSAGADGVWM